MAAHPEPNPTEQAFGEWWDAYSNQPRKLPATAKPRLGTANLAEYLKVAATALAAAPRLAWHYARPAPPRPMGGDFAGLSVSLNPPWHGALQDMVAELGVRRLLLRVPGWDLGRLDAYRRFTELFPGCEFLINILQDRASVSQPQVWAQRLRAVFQAFAGRADEFQIGNAMNRTKWGCAHSGEALRVMAVADRVRQDFAQIKLAGSSVIDFEPLITLRTLVNRHPYRLDACAAQLYVNRRGSPYRRQYRWFDLERKIRLLYAMTAIANRSAPRLWITETNWPLLDTRPYTPNSGQPRSTVDEATQAAYLKLYYQIAWRTGLVERVYWWQLLNPGYGLVDHRGGRLRKLPSYQAFKEIAGGALFDGD